MMDPPDFDNIDIQKHEDDDNDLFASAVQNIEDNDDDLTESITSGGFPKLQISSSSAELQNVPINNPSAIDSPILDKNGADDGDQFLEITIPESQKMGDGMNAYVAYKVHTRTNIPLFKKREMVVMRRFSDFLGLHSKLSEKYLRSGRIIPPAPEKSVIGMTKIKMSNQPDQGSSSTDFVERRRASLERYIRRTAQHPVLRIDPDFREFLEADIELPKATNTSALSGAGVMRLFNKVGETVNKITYKMDETDPWFEEKVAQVESLDAQLRKLHGSVETLVLNRRELAACTGAVAKSAAMLSNCEERTSLSRALSQLADVQEKVETVHIEQANTDFFALCEQLKDYIGLLGAVKDAFHERTKVFQTWQHSQQMLSRRRENKAKLELSGRSDKLDQAGVEVIEWEAKVERGQEEFDKISRMIKKEMEAFEETRIKDFKTMFIKHLEDHMEHQLQLVKYWEAFLPEAKAIA